MGNIQGIANQGGSLKFPELSRIFMNFHFIGLIKSFIGHEFDTSLQLSLFLRNLADIIWFKAPGI